jgi:hypothetical protein
MPPLIQILCIDHNPRIEYAFRHIFGNTLGWDYMVHNTLEVFADVQGLKFNYSNTPSDDALCMVPHDIVYQNDIQEQNIKLEWVENLPVFFKTRVNTLWDYDIIAMAFYILSRYEEYLPFEPDPYGRYKAKKSLAFRYDFLQIPVLDYWAIRLGRAIASKAGVEFIQYNKSYNLLSTIDIDQAWAFDHKSWRNLPGMFNDLIRFQGAAFVRRLTTMFKVSIDPFHCFSYIHVLHQRSNVDLMYFVLLSAKARKEDANHPVDLQVFRDFLLHLSDGYPVFLHPSLAAFEEERVLKNEKNNLEIIIDRPITKSRQHFLCLRFPNTYRSLISAGIQEDYSMMYHDHAGFRAGTSFPFSWYDLERECNTQLIIHPPCLMDVNLKLHQKLSIEESLKQITDLKAHVRNVNGCFQFIWHNSSLSEIYGWKGWREVYEFLLSSD